MINRIFITILLIMQSVLVHANTHTILVMGDSLSAAYNLKEHEGWVALMSTQLQKRNIDIRVINASISGETTQGGVARLNALLKRHQPTVVILELGANDALRGYPLQQTQNNLATMIQASTSQGAQVLLVGNRIPPNYGRRYTEQFFNLFAQLAEQYALAYLPFMLENVALDDTLMQDDGLHPNANGQPIILDNIMPVLLPMLSQ